MKQPDVLVIGSGVMGAATAWWLCRLAPRLRVLLVERDPSHQRASSSLSASSIRQQFGCEVNVRLSRFGIDFLRQAHQHLGLPGHPLDLGLTEPGYLYLATPPQAAGLRAAHALQTTAGADVALLAPPELGQRFGWLEHRDLALGSLGLSGEGWFDGPALHQAFLRAALALGAKRMAGEVVALRQSGGRTVAVALADGQQLSAGQVVNAAGPWAARVAAMAGIALPVEAARRTVFVLSSPAQLPNCPLVIDPSGWWLRPEGRHFLFGPVPTEVAPESPLQPDWSQWNEDQWAALAHRIPALAALRVERAWAGYYEMNRFDQNAVIGPHPASSNLFFINGFSGHGMQHAPGAALALAEWMLHGKPQTLDVHELGFERLLQQRPLREGHVIG